MKLVQISDHRVELVDDENNTVAAIEFCPDSNDMKYGPSVEFSKDVTPYIVNEDGATEDISYLTDPLFEAHQDDTDEDELDDIMDDLAEEKN